MPEPSEARTNVQNLVDNTGGAVSDTLADVPAAYAEATLANQLASLTGKVNELINALRNRGVID